MLCKYINLSPYSVPLAHRVQNAHAFSMNDLTQIMQSTIEKQKRMSEFNKLYKELFVINKVNDDFKGLRRFVRRSNNHT